ncbi:MAG: carbon-nitrogen hydrolase family protein [Deltaproteobacteria bacterium]|nr:carbon-nitrogen hydrolase family protein [Deltaproteobacteria bacterium]
MGDTFPTIKLAAVQAAPVFLNREASVEKACRLIREAGANGADFVGFPENFIPGHPIWYHFHPATSPKALDLAVALFENAVEIRSNATDALCDAAADANVFVVMGLTERRGDTTGTLFNTQLFIDRCGQIVGKHQKIVPTVGERLVHAGGAGSSQGVVMSEWGPVSGLCCGENSNPMAVALLATQYTRIHVANWPNHFTPGYHSMAATSLLASRNIAYMCKCFVISPCGTISPDMVETLACNDKDRDYLLDPKEGGGSVILDPRADIIAGPLEGDHEGIIYAEADLKETVRGRFIHDFGGHYNRTDVFRLLWNDASPSLVSNATSGGVSGEAQDFWTLDGDVTDRSPQSKVLSPAAGDHDEK